METLVFIFNTVFPVFILIALGYIFFRLKLIDAPFNSVASRIVFSVALPCMIFNELISAKFSEMFDLAMIAFIYGGTILSLLAAWLVAGQLKLPPCSKGAFIQACFRGNFVIIGIALIANMQQKILMSKAALAIAFIMPIYNILSILVLAFYNRAAGGFSIKRVLIDICKNPLMLALAAGLLFPLTGLTLFPAIQKTVNYFSALILPLALLSIGGTLAESTFRSIGRASWTAAIMRVVIFPVFLVSMAWLAGYRNDDLLLMFVIFASPTAIVSYIMAEAMGADSVLAGSVIFLSTVLSVFSISLGLYLLKILALV